MYRAIVLLSGGLDSTTCATLAVARHTPTEVLGISVHYGQKHELEISCAHDVSAHLGMDHEVIELPRSLMAGGKSTLVQGGPENPTGTYAELPYGVSPTYVPFRNGTLLSIASALAMKYEAEEIWFGAHAEDAENWAYPDCTPEFIGAMANAIWVGTYHKTRLVTPLEWMTKANVVATGLAAGAPYHRTMSCYNGVDPACGHCPTCLSRLDAFAMNGVEDPIAYAESIGGRL